MYWARSDGRTGCRVRQNRGLQCALAAFVIGLGAGHACAQCTERQKLRNSDDPANSFFGRHVSVSGDTAVVQSSSESCVAGDLCGAADVFQFNGVSWVEEQKLTASDSGTADAFGASLSLSGDTMVVGATIGPLEDCAAGGACGSAYVFRSNGTAWVEEQKLTVSDGVANDLFGWSVSVSGDTVVVGTPRDDCATGSLACGSAYVFRFNGASWVEEQKLLASDAKSFAEFGGSVSVSGETVFVGASFSNCAAGDFCGAAYVFRFNGTSWVEQQKLTASDAEVADMFGASVFVSGDAAVVGAVLDDCVLGDDCGSAYVYRFNGTAWVEEQKLIASDATPSARFGSSLSLSGDTVVVGAWRNGCARHPAIACGAAYVYRFNGTSWVGEQKLTASDSSDLSDAFGKSVSVSGDTVMVGAPKNRCAAGDRCGAAYVFDCLSECGNDNHDLGEQCDGGLSCTGCLCDSGFEPTLPRSVDCEPTCGNASLNLGEACDGMDDAACPGACLNDCTCGPFCGNGVCDPGEDSCNCPNDCGTPPPSESFGATCADGIDNDCDGLTDSADPDCTGAIPTVSAWGLIVMALLLLTGLRIKFGGRRPQRTL